MPRPIAVFIFLSFWTVTAVATDVLRLSEPVHSDAHTETFGQILKSDLPDVTLQQLQQNPSAFQNTEFQLTTRIAKVCQKKGCFFIAQEGDAVMRVAFKDYGFFIPTNTSGKTVTLTGRLVGVERSQAKADHFNSDLGQQAIVLNAGQTYEIVANSVRIPR